MVIERIFIDAFGKFNKTEFKLNSGINVVFGANESGKTTLMWFIKSMLYSLRGRNKKSSHVDLYKKYMPWQGNEFKGRMEYTLDNGEKFFIERDFNTNSVKIFDCFMTDISSTFDQSKEKGCLFAKKHLGISEECFERTSFIGQTDIKIDSNKKSEILNKLVNISQTGIEDISLNTAIKALKEALLNYVGTDKTSTRPLDIVNVKLQELRNKQRTLIDKRGFDLLVEKKIHTFKNIMGILERTKATLEFENTLIEVENGFYNTELNESIERIIHCKKEIADSLGKMDELMNTKKKYNVYEKYQREDVDDIIFSYKKIIDLKKNSNIIETELTRLKDKIISIEAYLEEYKVFNNLDENIEDIVKNILEYIDNSNIEKEKNEVKFINDTIKKYLIKKRWVQIGIIISFTGIIAGIKMWSNGYKFMTPFLFTIITLILFYVMGFISKNIKHLTMKKEELDNIIDNTSIKLSQNQKRLDDIYSKAQVTTIEHLLRKKDLYNEKVSEFTAINGKIDDFEKEMEKNSHNIKELEKKVGETLAYCKIMWSNKEELEDRHMELFKDGVKICRETENSILQLNEKIESLKRYLESLYDKAIYICSSEIKHHEETIINFGSHDEELDNIQRQIEQLSHEKTYLEEIAFSIRTAIETLEESSDEINKNYIPYLSKKTSEIMGKITQNRYSDIKSDANLILKTMYKETGSIVDVSMLSIGTIDQIYLALRLALVQLIENGGEKLPLIMDEIFAYFDDNRINKTIKVLIEMMSDRQVIFFTCKKREVEWLKYGCGNELNILELS